MHVHRSYHVWSSYRFTDLRSAGVYDKDSQVGMSIGLKTPVSLHLHIQTRHRTTVPNFQAQWQSFGSSSYAGLWCFLLQSHWNLIHLWPGFQRPASSTFQLSTFSIAGWFIPLLQPASKLFSYLLHIWSPFHRTSEHIWPVWVGLARVTTLGWWLGQVHRRAQLPGWFELGSWMHWPY